MRSHAQHYLFLIVAVLMKGLLDFPLHNFAQSVYGENQGQNNGTDRRSGHFLTINQFLPLKF